VDIGPGLPLILVDRLQIEQALLNLTRNAVEAIQESGMRSGTITLYARELTRGSVELGVVDTGPGFSPDFSLDRLQPFNSHKDDGLGIGLSLCQSIALANHGQLQVHKSAAGAHVAIAFDPDRRVKND
jgi:two-component system sensor kinase FixL